MARDTTGGTARPIGLTEATFEREGLRAAGSADSCMRCPSVAATIPPGRSHGLWRGLRWRRRGLPSVCGAAVVCQLGWRTGARASHGTSGLRPSASVLRLGRERDGVIEGVTHQDLGEMVGAHRETVTKILDELQQEGAVELARRRVLVRRRDTLTALLDE